MFPTEIHGLPEWCAQTLRGAWPGAWLRPPARARVWEKRTEGTAEAPSGPALGRRGVTRAAPPLPSSSASPLEEVEAPRSAAVERSSQLPVCAPARPALTMRPLVLLWACLVLPGERGARVEGCGDSFPRVGSAGTKPPEPTFPFFPPSPPPAEP